MNKQSSTPAVMLAAIVAFGYVAFISALLVQVMG
jgi:hypothetical protein